MSKLGLNQELIAKARASAHKVAADVQAFIDEHTTVTVERAVCRLLGIDGVNEVEVPLPNVVVDHLKEKVDAGCEFLTTQMFFDNNILYNFMYKALKHGIDVPVVAGIMPITNANQVKRSIALSGSLVPRRFLAIVDRFGSDPAAMKQAGIAYATDQIIDLIANGVNHVHIYTMNKPDVAGAILENLSDIYVRD